MAKTHNIPVIASGAKQSMPPRKEEWIASAFAR
jgi:hypothetical protein